MRKHFLFFLASLFFAPFGLAQVTTVTGTVKDVNGVAYAGASLKAQLVLSGVNVTGQPTVTVSSQAQCRSAGMGNAPCQVPFSGTMGPITLDPTGSFTLNLQDNSLVTPAATQWLFSVNTPGSPPPLGTGPQACSATITISGASQSVSGSFSACPALSAGGGVSSPSSLTAFFNGYQGFSPLDCGNAACTVQDLTAGNGRTTQDGVLSSGSAVVTSATMGFCNGTSVACSGLESNGQPKITDVGRQFEAVCGASSVGAVTVASVQSSSQITLSATQSTCAASSLQIFIGSDNTQTLQNWVANSLANHAVHSVYLPKGVYYTTKPLRFVNANASSECSGAVNPTSGFVFCGFALLGSGAAQSIIHPATQPNFLWTTGSTSTNGVIFVSNFSFGIIQGVGVVGDTVSYAATGLAGGASGVGGLVLTNTVQHFFVNENWINGIGISDATPSNRGGLIDGGCFECLFTNNAVESNGVDAEIVATLAEKETYDTNFLENAGNSQPLAGTGLQINGSNVKQAVFRNMHFKGPNNSSAGLIFQPGFTIATGYTVEFDLGRMDQGSASDVGAWVRACTGGTIEFNGFNFLNTNNNAAVSLLRVDNGPTTCPVVVNGGTMSPGGASSKAVLNNGTGGVWLQGVNCLNGCGLSGTGTTNQFIQQASGWGGLGGITGTFFLSNQGTGCAIGNFALSAGWGTTAAPTAPAGFNQSCRITITASGTGQAANPTITWALPTALPAATTACEAHQSGGTGAFTMMLQTSLSATAPIFTLQGTPTAAATYIYDIRCGP